MIRALLFACLIGSATHADPVDILEVTSSGIGPSNRFDVTLAHPDTGWDHYADGWRVELADGTVLGTRTLFHPHVTEQPFTRSHTVPVPEGTVEVFIRAKCSVDGWGEITVSHQLGG